MSRKCTKVLCVRVFSEGIASAYRLYSIQSLFGMNGGMVLRHASYSVFVGVDTVESEHPSAILLYMAGDLLSNAQM